MDAIERNHEEQTKQSWPSWVPVSDRDTPYRWHMITHPTSGEVALAIPEAELPLLSADEIADLETELTPDWTTEAP